jgi:hypothetical protein
VAHLPAAKIIFHAAVGRQSCVTELEGFIGQIVLARIDGECVMLDLMMEHASIMGTSFKSGIHKGKRAVPVHDGEDILPFLLLQSPQSE